MKDGPAVIALMIGMVLAFGLNHAGKPIWLSLLAGFGVGLGLYILLTRIKSKRKDQ